MTVVESFRMDPSWQSRHIANIRHNVNDPLSAIYNESVWRVNKVSALYNLQYDEVKLKQYASKIRHGIVNSVPVMSTVKYKVQIEIEPFLKYCENDADALMITVSSTRELNNNTNKNSHIKIAYTAILLSWGVSSSLPCATHLPYLLERGEQKVGTAVKATLQTIFDCNIKRFYFTQNQLLLFGFNFIESDSSRSTDPFTLSYTMPDSTQRDRLNLSFTVGDILIIWNGVKEEVTDQSEYVKTAYRMLQNQIFHTIMLDVNALSLCQVTLPKAEVKDIGVVKMKTPEAVNSVLLVLNVISDIDSTARGLN